MHYTATVELKGRHKSLTEICYLYSVKIKGEGVRRKWSCKDTELTLKKIEGVGGPRSYLYTVKIANFRQTLMSSLTLTHHDIHVM